MMAPWLSSRSTGPLESWMRSQHQSLLKMELESLSIFDTTLLTASWRTLRFLKSTTQEELTFKLSDASLSQMLKELTDTMVKNVNTETDKIEEMEVSALMEDHEKNTARVTEMTTTATEVAHTVEETPNSPMVVVTTEEGKSREARVTTTISMTTSLRERREITVVTISTKNLLLSTKLLQLKRNPSRCSINREEKSRLTVP